ncbi:hypothetical protein ACQPYE_24825 [Actinosynnema sp. CA-299493]
MSHGELLRSGNDQALPIDPCRLQFLHQGLPPTRVVSTADCRTAWVCRPRRIHPADRPEPSHAVRGLRPQRRSEAAGKELSCLSPTNSHGASRADVAGCRGWPRCSPRSCSEV